MLYRIVQIIAPVFLIIGVGYIYGRRYQPDMTAFNRITLNVLCPLLVFSALAVKSFDLLSHWRLLLATAIVVLGSGLLSWPIARALGEDPKTFVPPMMFNNSGNMGLPLALLAFGPESLGEAAALFVVSNLLQFTVGARLVGGHLNLKQVLLSPMIIATALGVVVSISNMPLPAVLLNTTKLLGDATIPLMLFSLGVRMVAIDSRSWILGLIGAVVCPMSGLAIGLFIAFLLHIEGAQFAMLMLFCSLPPAVLNFLVAEHYKQEADKVASIVLFGNLGAVVFVPLALAIGLPTT